MSYRQEILELFNLFLLEGLFMSLYLVATSQTDCWIFIHALAHPFDKFRNYSAHASIYRVFINCEDLLQLWSILIYDLRLLFRIHVYTQFWHQGNLLVDASVGDGYHLRLHSLFHLRWTAWLLAGYVSCFLYFVVNLSEILLSGLKCSIYCPWESCELSYLSTRGNSWCSMMWQY